MTALHTFRSLLLAPVFLLAINLQGCAVEDDGAAAEEEGSTDSALVRGTMEAGTTLTTTARLNFREGPSKAETIKRVFSLGAKVKAVGGAATNGYYEVTSEGETGWAFGRYLKAAGANNDDTNDDAEPAPGTASAEVASTGSCAISYYATGRQTANGEAFKPDGLTAAHKTLPFNTKVRVTNLTNGKSVVVRINDRGPFIAGRCIDLARGAFRAIASLDEGVLQKSEVKYEVLK